MSREESTAPWAVLNAFEIRTRGHNRLKVLFIEKDVIDKMTNEQRHELKMMLREQNIPYYWSPTPYLELEAGVYVFGEAKLPSFIKHASTRDIDPKSYPAKYLLGSLIDTELRKKKSEVLEFIGKKYGTYIYRLRKPLVTWPEHQQLFQISEVISYRVEHVKEIISPALRLTEDKLLLLVDRRVSIYTLVSLEDLVNLTGRELILNTLLGKPMRIINESGTRDIGTLEGLDDNAIMLVRGEQKHVPLNAVYLLGTPLWYRDFLEQVGRLLGDEFRRLVDAYGEVTYRYRRVDKKRQKIEDAPRRLHDRLLSLRKLVFDGIFPIHFQGVEYTLDEMPVRVKWSTGW